MARVGADANVRAGPRFANMERMAVVPRFRRSRRAMLAILVAAFLLGVQGGVAVLPMRADGEALEGRGVGPSPPSLASAPPGSTRAAELAPPAATTDAGAETRAAPEAGDAPPEDPVPVANPAQPDPAEERRRADADRLWGCLRAMESTDLGVAFEAATAAADLTLTLGGRERLGAAWSDLCARVRGEVGAALRAAAAGRVELASRQLGSLSGIEGPGRALAQRVVRDAATAQGVPWDPGRRGEESDVAAPAPLPRGLRVAFSASTGVRFDGVVRAERGGTVSVEVAGVGGRRFPTAPRFAVEPQAATVELALDQCAVSLLQGERAWAVAWWVRARSLGADGARLAQLAVRLGG